MLAFMLLKKMGTVHKAIQQFEGVRPKFSMSPSAVRFPLNCRKIGPDPVHRERLQKMGYDIELSATEKDCRSYVLTLIVFQSQNTAIG
jgi:hypothetical protein